MRVAIAVLALLMIMAGCLGGFGGDDGGELTGDYSATEFDALLSNATTANEDTESFSFEMTMTMDGAGESVSMNMTGNTDVVAQEMTMDVEMHGLGMVGPNEFTMYIDGEQAYVNADGSWQTVPIEDVNEDVWNVEDRLAIAQAQYEYGNVHVEAGTEMVEVTTELDADAMSKFLAEAESADPAMADPADAEWQNVKIVERFDAETHRLTSTTMSADMTVNGQTFDYTFEMQIDDVNEDLETAVPEEATNATDTAA